MSIAVAFFFSLFFETNYHTLFLFLGIERKSRIISKEEKKVFAYHEAGHVLVGWFLKTTDPILKVLQIIAHSLECVCVF